MRCHQHLDQEAVAICVSCGRGLCRNCQQLTLDQRNLCSMPQCAEFARRQKALHEAVRQGCAHRATAFQLTGAFLRTFCLAVVVPSLLSVCIYLGWLIFTYRLHNVDFLYLRIERMLIVLLPVYFLWSFRSKLGWLQAGWEDLASGFRENPVVEVDKVPLNEISDSTAKNPPEPVDAASESPCPVPTK